MKKFVFALLAFFVLSGHDMFLKLDGYFLPPSTEATIKLYNGTFHLSENVIARSRMIDVSLVGNGERISVDTTQWSEEEGTTLLTLTTGQPGTWVAGVSTRPRNIEMAAEDFNNYLVHDGVLDMLEWRKENDALEQDAVEKYSKHVKTIFQVGEQQTDDWQTVLGYPIEFVPMSNPYDTHVGHELQFKLLWQGEPLANQLVYVGSDNKGHGHEHDHADEGHEHSHEHADESHEHSHEHSDEGHEHSHEHADESHEHAEADHEHAEEPVEEHSHHEDATQYRTDANGVLTVNLDDGGIWYLRTIHLVTSEEEGLTHESNWATLTFEVEHGDHSHGEHSQGEHGHSHAGEDHHHHDEEGGIPGYAYWIASLLLVLVLFFWFNRKSGE